MSHQSKLIQQDYLRNRQYKDARNLSARVQLHVRFRTNPYPWMRWVFDQVLVEHVSPDVRVLELGCGPGLLWRENLDRIPAGWRITLTDDSPGMVAQAQSNVASSTNAPASTQFAFQPCDAQAIPFEAAAFDVVIANHMLYHVPDLDRALGEIRRVLKPGGRFYAATNGQKHMWQLHDLAQAFESGRLIDLWPALNFTLENGADWLSKHFAPVDLRRFENSLRVTDPVAIADYILSMNLAQPASVRQALVDYVREKMTPDGIFLITNETGLFVAR